MGLKYTIDFTNADNSRTFQIGISDVNFTGSSTSLNGSDRPFVLREFNTNEDLFKPIRAMMAEINIVTNSTGVTMDDFISENDTDITVTLDASMPFGGIQVFNGILLQDDFQETWIDGNHILTLKAADRFGYLKKVQLSNNGAELQGKFTPFQLMRYCLQETSLSTEDFYIVNNLYHESMSTAPGTTSLMQCLIDARTFQIETSNYEDCYTVLEKINKAFNQTIFAYRNRAFILRLEELYTSYTNNLRGFLLYDPGIGAFTVPFTKRFEFLVGTSQDTKPITPEMIRFIERKTKVDTVEYEYNQYEEIIKNQSFSRGNLLSETVFQKVYSINNWVALQGAGPATGVPTDPNTFYRVQEFSDTRSLKDDYMQIVMSPTTNRWAYSEPIEVLANELFSFSIDCRFANPSFTAPSLPGSTRLLVQFQLTDGVSYYLMDNTGTWFVSNGSWTLNSKFISVYMDGGEQPVKSDEWTTIQVDSKQLPIAGELRVLLWCFSLNYEPNQAVRFKNMKFDYTNSSSNLLGKSIKAIQSIYTKTLDIKNDYSDKIFLDDGVSKQFKGAIFEMDGLTLTSPDWFRYRYSTERFGFRKQNAIAHWEHNRANRNKIDATFFGCFWNDGVNDEVISPINTLRFIDDDINRVYAILAIKDMDFAANTWNATLIEVFNEITDVDISESFIANLTQGTYTIEVTIPEYKLPLTLQSAGGFVINGGNTAKYLGLSSITSPISCSVAGFMKITNPQQTTVTLSLRKNGVAIKTASLQVFNPNTPFSFSLSTDPIAINTNDEFTITTSPNIYQIQILGGSIQINTPSITQSFDPYQDKFIYK